MADKTDNNESLDISFEESEWISSTPMPIGRYETKFNSAFDESLESEYASALSAVFTNSRKSLSIIGTKGSPNASDPELASPTLNTDYETEKEDLSDHRKNIDFDADEVAQRKDISYNIEKNQSFVESDIFKNSLSTTGTIGSTIALYSELSSPSLLTDSETEKEDSGENRKNIDLDADEVALRKYISRITEKNQSVGESDIFKKSLSTTGTIGSTIASYSELSSPTLLTDNETGKGDPGENRKNIDLDADEVALRKDISWITEKHQSVGESDIFKKSSSTAGTVGSTASSSGLSSPRSLTDDETEETDQEENGEHSKNIYFDEDVAGLRRTFNDECALVKYGNSINSSNKIFVSSPIDIGKFKKSPTGESNDSEILLGRENMVSDVKTDIQSCKIEKESHPEQQRESSNVWEVTPHRIAHKQSIEIVNEECPLEKDGNTINRSNKIFISSSIDIRRFQRSPTGESNVSEIFLGRENMVSDIKPDFQSCKIEKESFPEQARKSSNVWECTHRVADKQNIQTLNEECPLEEHGNTVKRSNKILISSPIDLERFQTSSMPLNVSSSNLKRKVQENTSTKSGPFCTKRQKLDEDNQTGENYVLATKSAPPSPISHSSNNARGFYLNSLKKERKSLSYFYNKFNKNILKSKQYKESNRILWENAKYISKAEPLQEIESESSKPLENTEVNNDHLIHSDKNLVPDNALACHPFVTCVIKEEGQYTLEYQRSKAHLSCFSPQSANSAENVAEIQDDPATETKENLESNVTMRENYVSTSEDSFIGLKDNNASNLSSIINETKFDSRDSNFDIKSNSLSTFRELSYPDRNGNFDSQDATANFGTNQRFSENDAHKKIWGTDKILPEIPHDIQDFKSKPNLFTTEQTSENSDICEKNQNNVYNTALARGKTLSEGEPIFQNFELKENLPSEQKGENTNVRSHISHGISVKKGLEKLHQNCTLKEDGSNEKSSNEIFSPKLFNLKSLMALNKSLEHQRKILQGDHTPPKSKKTFETPTSKTYISDCFPHWTTSAEYAAEAQDDQVIEKREIVRSSATMGDVLASKDSSVGLEKNDTQLSSTTDETKFDSRDSDIDIKSNSLLTSKEISYTDGICNFDPRSSTANSGTNVSTISNLICCPFCKNTFSEASQSKSNLMEVTTDNEDENDRTTKEYCPSIGTILDIFNTDNALAKNILLAILSEDPQKGATYTEIVKYLKKERIFSTKHIESVKKFLRTAVNVKFLRMERRRYFLVSRDSAAKSQLIQTDGEELNRNSSNELINIKVFSSGTKSKLRKENNLKEIPLVLAKRRKIFARNTGQVSQEMNS